MTRERMEHRDGVPWYKASKPLSRLHRHRWQTRAFDVYGGKYPLIERCACGAAHEGDGLWYFLGRDKPRVRFF